MRALLVFLGLAVVLVLGLWFTGVFSDPADVDPTGDGTSTTDPEGTDPTTLRAGAPPKERPDAEWTPFPDGTRVLHLGRTRNVEALFVQQLLGDAREVSYQYWYLNEGGAQAQGRAKGMDKLASMPDGTHLAENDISLVVLDNVDPNDLLDEFWISLNQRVQEGRTGLLVKAYWPLHGIEGAITVHPVLTHPVLRDLVPVAEAEPIKGRADGSGVPGIMKERRYFVVTEDGTAHPASRLVRWKKWSREWWNSFRSGVLEEDAWLGTQFVYPVTQTAEGAQTLVGVDVPEGDPIPALIVSSGDVGRVAWLGIPQLGWRAQYNAVDKANMGVIYHNLLAWLAGADLQESN